MSTEKSFAKGKTRLKKNVNYRDIRSVNQTGVEKNIVFSFIENLKHFIKKTKHSRLLIKGLNW